MEEWHAIQVLKRQGHGKKAVARQLGISRNTVKRHWDCQGPPAYRRALQEKMLDAYTPQIKDMIDQHFIGTRIFQELLQLGYTGSLTTVYRGVRQFKHHESHKHIPAFRANKGQIAHPHYA